MSSDVRFTDFKSDKQPTWCPGCGDFGTMNGMMKALAETGNDPDNTFVCAGIGCSGKIGTYMHSYALHGVHGRALPVGTGVKLANPDLEVMVAGGEFDARADWEGATVDAVKRVAVHVGADFAGTADARHDEGVVRVVARVGQRLHHAVHRAEVPASGAPRRLFVGFEIRESNF